ncbi:MAG: hypothetical protein WDM81_13770 [Rhizomicrobium sp.]
MNTQSVNRSVSAVDLAIGARLKAIRVARGPLADAARRGAGPHLSAGPEIRERLEPPLLRHRLARGAVPPGRGLGPVRRPAGRRHRSPDCAALPVFDAADLKLIEAARRLPDDIRRGIASFCGLLADGMARGAVPVMRDATREAAE